MDIGGGTGSPAIRINGANTSGAGPYLQFARGGTQTNVIGPYSIVATGTSNDLTYYSATSYGHVWFVNGQSSTINMQLDSSGNLGLGVTPSAWNSSFKAIQAGRSASFYGRDNATYDQAGLYSNAVFDATDSRWEYIIDNSGAGLPASGYLQSAGAHSWYTAPSGTVGNLISFTQALTLTANGALLVGDTSDISNGITNAAVSTKGQGTSGSRRATASEMGVTATLAQNDTANTYSFGGYGGYGLFVAEGSDPSTAWRAAAIVWSSGAALTILSLGSSNITVGSTGTTITVQNTSASSEAISWSMLVLG